MRALRPGDPVRVGDYTTVGLLGHGAMGTVFLARSRGGRQVAVKVVRPELADDDEFRERFRQEVAAMRAVGGFWTAAVVDADPDGPTPWLASEYVPGPTLREAVASGGPFSVPRARALLAGIAEALRVVHAAGLVHRDLKPANVLLAADGPRVIDFGIAKALAGAGLTATGMLVGTPGFLSPEQIEGHQATPASDVFALGSVMVYATTGDGPFGTGTMPAMVYRIVHGEPDLDRVPEELRQLVARCLARRPEERPDPEEVLTEVARLGPAEWEPIGPEAAPGHAQPTTSEGSHALPHPTATDQPGTSAPLDGSPQSGEAIAPTANSSAAIPDAPAPPELAAGPGAAAQTAVPPAATRVAPFGVAGRPGAPATSPYDEVRGTVFRVGGRWSSVVPFVLFAAAAAVCVVMGLSLLQARQVNGAVLSGLVFLLFAWPAARRFWMMVRPRRWLEVSAAGVTVGVGQHSRLLEWPDLARARVVENGPRPWLVVWLRDATVSRAGLGSLVNGGGLRAYPVAHGRATRVRRRELRELRAALAWHGNAVYDPNP